MASFPRFKKNHDQFKGELVVVKNWKQLLLQGKTYAPRTGDCVDWSSPAV